MTLHNIIYHTQVLANYPGLAVPRMQYVEQYAARIAEQSKVVFCDVEKMEFASPLQIVSVERVLEATRMKLDIPKIGLEPVADASVLDPELYSYVDYHTDCPVIVYRNTLNFCWQRFAVVKELLHLYTDTAKEQGWLESVPIIDAGALVDDAISSAKRLPSADADLDDELTALVMANEIMIPWQLRPQLKHLQERGADNGQIARAFLMPRLFVDRLLGEWRGVGNAEGETYAERSWRINLQVEGQLRQLNLGR